MCCEAEAELEGVGLYVVVILVVGAAHECRAGNKQTPVFAEVELENGVDNKQRGVALVALSIKMQRVDGAKVFLLVALPGENLVELGVQNEAAEVAQLEVGFRLGAETAAHVVVAVYHVVVVALGAAKQYAVNE